MQTTKKNYFSPHYKQNGRLCKLEKLFLRASFRFPLFTTIYKICYEGRSIQDFISCLQEHPEHI